MNIIFCISEINWLSVLVATVSSFAIGSVWYSPMTFIGKAWINEVKITEDKQKGANMPLIFGTTFILNFIAAIILDLIIGASGTLISGIVSGAIISAAFIATAFGTSYLFTMKSLKLYLIDAGYYIVLFIAMGAILGAW